jgi:hypothetical protein
MPTAALCSLRALWEETFRIGLTRPGFDNFIVIVSGWLLTQGTHAVTEALVMADVSARRHHEAFHRFFSRGTCSPDKLGEWCGSSAAGSPPRRPRAMRRAFRWWQGRARASATPLAAPRPSFSR